MQEKGNEEEEWEKGGKEEIKEVRRKGEVEMKEIGKKERKMTNWRRKEIKEGKKKRNERGQGGYLGPNNF